MIDSNPVKEPYVSPNFSDGLYHKTRHIRDIIFHRMAIILTFFRVSADILTIMGVVMTVLFVFFIQVSEVAAVVCLVMSVILDSMDGVLARYQRVASDRGKFLDVMADNFGSFLFAFGLAIAHIVHPLILIAHVYFMLLGKVFKVYLNSFDYKSDWLFRAVAGFGTNLINYAAYLLFIVHVFVKFNINTPFLIITVALMLYSLWHFIRIYSYEAKVT